MAEEEEEKKENIAEPIAELLRSDADAQRIEGAGKLKEIASDPKYVSSLTLFFLLVFLGGSPSLKPEQPVQYSSMFLFFFSRMFIRGMPLILRRTHAPWLEVVGLEREGMQC